MNTNPPTGGLIMWFSLDDVEYFGIAESASRRTEDAENAEKISPDYSGSVIQRNRIKGNFL